MKKVFVIATALISTFNFQLSTLHAQSQPTAVTHYWSIGLSSSTPFFFATYNPGGSDIFFLDGAYTYCLGRNWQLGGGLGIGGGASDKQLYRSALGDTLGTATRNPYVIPIFLRAKYLFSPHRSSGWYAALDAGYMLGFVRGYDDEPYNYYSAFFSPSLGHQFGFGSSRTRISVGAGADFYLEGHEDELPPYGHTRPLHMNFLAYVTFDFGAGK